MGDRGGRPDAPAALALVRDRLAARLHLPPQDVRPESRLQEDLGLDSLMLAELLVTVQDDTGVELDLADLPDPDTLSTVAGLAGLLAGPDRIEVRSTGSAADVRAADWDALVAGRSWYLTWEWVHAQDRGQPVGARYLLAERGGELLGVLPTYLVERETNGFYRPERAVDGRWPGRYVLAGGRRGYANELLVRPGADAAAGALLEALAGRVTEAGADAALFLYLDTGAAERLTRLVPGATPLLATAEAVLDLVGTGLDDQLGALPAHRRRRIRHEIDVFSRAGYQLGVEPARDCWRALAPLFAQVQRRYGGDYPDEQAVRLLERQAAALDEWAVVLTLRDGDRLAGGVLAYPWQGTLHLKLHGLDYPRLRDAYEYFNLACYAPIRLGHRLGLRRLHLGREAIEAKIRRGGRLHPLWHVEVPARDDGGAARRWNAAEAARIRAASPTPRALTERGWGLWGAGDAV